MMCILALLLSSVAALCGVGEAVNSYIILVPKVIRPGLEENITVNLFRYHPQHYNSTVVATLEYTNLNIKNRTLTTSTGTFTPHVPGSLKLNIPKHLNETKYIIRVKSIEGLNFSDTTEVKVESKNMSIFVQTDKAIYQAGQTVNVRAFGLFPNGSVYKEKLNIFIKDPKRNLVKQWLDLHNPTYGVVETSMIMDDKPILGNWVITVNVRGISTTKIVEVSEYVLPKFKVTLDLPPSIHITDTEVTGTISAQYTFGKPASATVVLKVTIDNYYKPWTIQDTNMPMFQKTIHIHGEDKFTIPLKELYRFNMNYKPIIETLSGNHLKVEATVTEVVNKRTRTVTGRSVFKDRLTTLSFVSDHKRKFLRGLSQSFQVKISQDDQPPAGKLLPLHLQVFHKNTTSYPSIVVKAENTTYSVPPTGVVEFDVDFPSSTDIGEVRLKVNYGSLEETLDLSAYADQYMHIQLKLLSTNHRVGDIARIQLKATESIFKAFYQVTSKGFLLGTGSLDIKNNRTFIFTVPLTHSMAPEVTVLVYNLDFTGEVIADHISFTVDGFLQNKVALQFNETKVEPGDGITLTAQADPYSIVCLLAVDQSVLLLKSGNDLSRQEVVDRFGAYTPSPHYSFNFNNHYGQSVVHDKQYPAYAFDKAATIILTDAERYDHAISHSIYRSRNNPYLERSARQCDCGFLAVTTLPPKPDEFGNPIVYPKPGQQGTPTASPSTDFFGNPIAMLKPSTDEYGNPISTPSPESGLQGVQHLRQKFPETWLWINKTTGSNGKLEITSNIPDTITSWTASAFAISPTTGLGIAERNTEIQVFRAFFVTLNLPFSVIRGEELVLQANVFNYMATNMTVLVTLGKSSDFKNIIVDDMGYTQYISDTRTENLFVEAGNSATVYFPIVPGSLGKIDISVKAQSTIAADGIKRQLRVEAEGTPQEYSLQTVVDLTSSNSLSEELIVTFPSSVVAGSERVDLFVIGDFLGPSVSGMEKLLEMPYGCGEQTMINFAPDVFITDYLKATGQLSEKVKNKALMYLEKGYQRELRYQHTDYYDDGSFSSFGDRDSSGSMWLTAFVLKSFHQAKSHIFIDENVNRNALRWILRHQNDDGSFPEPGSVHSSFLKGSQNGKLSLTAFVLITLAQLEDYGVVINGKTQREAQRLAEIYIGNRVSQVTDPYALAICTYALGLTDNRIAEGTMAKLMSYGISQGNFLFWNTSYAHYDTWSPPSRKASTTDIETAAYALLYYSHKSDYTSGVPILRWLLTQRNSNGGFSSTQDTILSLQAMSEFAQLGHKLDGNNTMNLSLDVHTDSKTHTFSVNEKNAMVLQSVELDPPPRKINLTARGHGAGLFQVSVKFNVESGLLVPMFDLKITTSEETLNGFTIRTCTRYFGTEGASGMAIIEQGIPSGFEVVEESIKTTTMSTDIKKTEVEDHKVILYFDEIGSQEQCVELTTERVSMVAQTQPSPVRVYDYYNPEHEVTKFYHVPALRNSTYCDVCPSCTCGRRHK